jgi:hypothetical protein
VVFFGVLMGWVIWARARVPVPSRSDGNPYSTYEHDRAKPLPESATQDLRESSRPAEGGVPTGLTPVAPPAPPIVSTSYLDAYDRVGRPRLVVSIVRPDNPDRALVPGDYDLLERVVREVISGGGQIAVVPALAVKERLSAAQLRDLQSGQDKLLAEVGSSLRADVLIEVRIAPAGDQQQLTATAKNTRDGQPIASAAATIPSLSPRRQIDFAGRLLGERLVDVLADTWDRFARDLAGKPGSAPTPPAASSASPTSATSQPALSTPVAPPPTLPTTRP